MNDFTLKYDAFAMISKEKTFKSPKKFSVENNKCKLFQQLNLMNIFRRLFSFSLIFAFFLFLVIVHPQTSSFNSSMEHATSTFKVRWLFNNKKKSVLKLKLKKIEKRMVLVIFKLA